MTPMGDPPGKDAFEGEGFDPEHILERMRSEYWQGVERAPDAEPEEFTTLLVMHVGEERFGMLVGQVREVTRIPQIISRVPRGADVLMGVMNHRGQIIPLLDLRPVLGVKPSALGKEARIVVLKGQGRDIGLIAEEVAGLVDIGNSQWQEPLSVETALPPNFIKSQCLYKDKLLAVLDPHAFFHLDSIAGGFG